MCPCRLIETTHCHTVSITLENCKLLLCLHNGSKVALWVLARCFHRPRLCKSSAALWTRRSCHHWENSQILMTPLLFYHQGLHYHCRKFNTSCKGIFKHIGLSQFLEKKKKQYWQGYIPKWEKTKSLLRFQVSNVLERSA